MFRIFLFSFFKYILIVLPVTLVGYILLPFVLLFIPKHKETLPGVFRLWDNFSGPKVDGLAGDWPYRVSKGMGVKIWFNNENPGFNFWPYENPFWADHYYKQTAGYWKVWWRRYVWLAWRNPADCTKGIVLGKEFTNKEILSIGREGNSRNRIRFYTGDVYSEIYWTSKPFYKTYRQRLRCGFKCDTMEDVLYQSTHESYKDRKFLRFEFSYSPFHRQR